MDVEILEGEIRIGGMFLREYHIKSILHFIDTQFPHGWKIEDGTVIEGMAAKWEKGVAWEMNEKRRHMKPKHLNEEPKEEEKIRLKCELCEKPVTTSVPASTRVHGKLICDKCTKKPEFSVDNIDYCVGSNLIDYNIEDYGSEGKELRLLFDDGKVLDISAGLNGSITANAG